MKLHRLITLIFAFSAALLVDALAHAAPSINKNVVYVQIESQSGAIKSTGSGILIGATGFILTARHVLEMGTEATDKIKVGIANKEILVTARRFQCEQNPYLDLCVLYVTKQHIKNALIDETFGFDCRIPDTEETIRASGYPLDPASPLITVPGTVSSDELGVEFKQYMAAPILPGMSGGPVLDRNDRIVGIIYGSAEGLSNLSMFVPAIFSKPLLNSTGSGCIEAKQATVGSDHGTLVASITRDNILGIEPAPANTWHDGSEYVITPNNNLGINGKYNYRVFDKGSFILCNEDALSPKRADNQEGPGGTRFKAPKFSSCLSVQGLNAGFSRDPSITVYVQYSSDADAGIAKKLVDALADSGISAPGTERTDDITSPAAPTIVYFNDEDIKYVERVKELAEAETDRTFSISLEHRAVWPRGVVEVWFGR